MLENIFKINKKMGESRGAQIAGIIILISLVVFAFTWTYIKGYIQ